MIKNILKKEFLLVLRNTHALGVLFIMPMVFILIMSLALKDTFSNQFDKKLHVVLDVEKIDTISQDILDNLHTSKYFEFTLNDKNMDKKELIYNSDIDYVVKIPKNIFQHIHLGDEYNITLYSKPDSNPQINAMLQSSLLKAFTSVYVKSIAQMEMLDLSKLTQMEDKIVNQYIYRDKQFDIKPNAVQQSVPAWLVFSMFFILIPISNTFLQEKDYGTFDRLKTINVPSSVLLFGKIIPYFVINFIQFILMVCVGIFIVPLLGGDSLQILGSYFNLFVIVSFVSFAAISFALLIANIAKTTEEATAIGGITNIIFAALGGIMVPKVVMPEFMQDITIFSPMSWGLESFLEVLVHGGSLGDIYNYLLWLLLFGLLCLGITNQLMKRYKN